MYKTKFSVCYRESVVIRNILAWAIQPSHAQRAIKSQMCGWQLIKTNFSFKILMFYLAQTDRRVVLKKFEKIAIRRIALDIQRLDF